MKRVSIFPIDRKIRSHDESSKLPGLTSSGAITQPKYQFDKIVSLGGMLPGQVFFTMSMVVSSVRE